MAQDVLSLSSPVVSPVPAAVAAPDIGVIIAPEEHQPRRSTLDAPRPNHSDSPSISAGSHGLHRKGAHLTLYEAMQRVKPAGA